MANVRGNMDCDEAVYVVKPLVKPLESFCAFGIQAQQDTRGCITAVLTCPAMYAAGLVTDVLSIRFATKQTASSSVVPDQCPHVRWTHAG